MPRPLVLASTSVYRKYLVERLELDFITASPDYDERAAEAQLVGITPDALATALAVGKAESLRAAHPDAWILGADQVPVLLGPPDEILHKPGTEARAVDQLCALAGRTHHMLTAVALLDARTGETRTAVDHQRLTMRQFSRAEAAAYVARHKPLDCAGSYRIEDPGIKLFARIEGGDYTGIIGLPLLAVTKLLREVGLLPADVAAQS
ncbi:MAG: nucleoside triphosphate pyrophosphatase [Nannocystaceae bacterium]|nr:septum formation protein Maf [Myxococcales bacterium]